MSTAGKTVRQMMAARLYDNGLFENEAEAVLSQVEKSENTAVREALPKPVDGYPPFLIGLVWLHVARETAFWLKENAPEHWALPLFEDKENE